MTKNFAIVTSLYNLSDVLRGDNRTWEDYLNWFSRTLRLKTDMIIYTEDSVVETIKSVRDSMEDYKTEIIVSKIEDIPYYGLKDEMQKVLDSDKYQEKMSDTDRVECNDSMYSVIQYSKFKWMREASENYNYDYYFWLDAGASRFISSQSYIKEYPSQDALEELDGIEDTLLIQYNHEYYPQLVEPEVLSIDYFWDNRSIICGSMFGGSKKSIENVEGEVDRLMKYMIDEGCLNNEQIVLGFLCKSRPELFTRYYRTNPNQHLDLFQELS